MLTHIVIPFVAFQIYLPRGRVPAAAMRLLVGVVCIAGASASGIAPDRASHVPSMAPRVFADGWKARGRAFTVATQACYAILLRLLGFSHAPPCLPAYWGRCAMHHDRHASCPSWRLNTLRSGTCDATVFRLARMAVSGAIPVADPRGSSHPAAPVSRPPIPSRQPRARVSHALPAAHQRPPRTRDGQHATRTHSARNRSPQTAIWSP